MQKVLGAFDDVPMATWIFVIGAVYIAIDMIAGDLSSEDAFRNLLFLGGGSGGIGYVRNQAGKGIRKNK